MTYYHHTTDDPRELAANRRFLPYLTDPASRIRAAEIYLTADVSGCENRREVKEAKYAAVYEQFPHAGPRSDRITTEVGRTPGADAAPARLMPHTWALRELLPIGTDVWCWSPKPDDWVIGTVHRVTAHFVYIWLPTTRSKPLAESVGSIVPVEDTPESREVVLLGKRELDQGFGASARDGHPTRHTGKVSWAKRWREKVREVFPFEFTDRVF